MPTKPEFNSQTQCFVVSYEYKHAYRTGHLYMADDSCCDMKGCIDFFVSKFPSVRTIKTFSGERPDTVYLNPEGEGWFAMTPSNFDAYVAFWASRDLSPMSDSPFQPSASLLEKLKPPTTH